MEGAERAKAGLSEGGGGRPRSSCERHKTHPGEVYIPFWNG